MRERKSSYSGLQVKVNNLDVIPCSREFSAGGRIWFKGSVWLLVEEGGKEATEENIEQLEA